LKKDLTTGIDRPMWPLSSFGSAKHEPNLVAGLDESQEELRFKAFTALKAGNTSEYVSLQTVCIFCSIQYIDANTV
jgi:nucleoporin NUP42